MYFALSCIFSRSWLLFLRKFTDTWAAAVMQGGSEVVKIKTDAKERMQSMLFLFPAMYPPNTP